jgi:hypothetical protein
MDDDDEFELEIRPAESPICDPEGDQSEADLYALLGDTEEWHDFDDPETFPEILNL